jgi:hypothetical protein
MWIAGVLRRARATAQSGRVVHDRGRYPARWAPTALSTPSSGRRPVRGKEVVLERYGQFVAEGQVAPGRVAGMHHLADGLERVSATMPPPELQRKRRCPSPRLSAIAASRCGHSSVSDASRTRSPSRRRRTHFSPRRCPSHVGMEERLLSNETRSVILIQAAINALPPPQREVVTLRDAQGFTSQEVCTPLHLSETNQRVLPRRGRSRLRRSLQPYVQGG